MVKQSQVETGTPLQAKHFHKSSFTNYSESLTFSINFQMVHIHPSQNKQADYEILVI